MEGELLGYEARAVGPRALTRGRTPLVVLGNLALAAFALWLAWRVAADVIVRPHRRALVIVPDVLRVCGASILLFGICGYGVTRLALPERLRAREPLWVLPIGACTSALALTVVGFMGFPFKVSLGLVLALGVGLALFAARRRGVGLRPRVEFAWPVYLAALLVAVAIVPMASLRYMTVTGTGSDAHLAAGTAQFLQHSYPTSVNLHQPVNQMPLTWRSKYPIYYAFAAIAELSGLQTYQVLTTLEGVMMALAAIGIYLLARDLLLVGLFGGICAMLLAGLDRAVLHTGLNPYFNQTWGWFGFPFALVLAGAVFARHLPGRDIGALAERPPRSERWHAALLLLLFLAIVGFAYPLALPIPLVAVFVLWRAERAERVRRGEPVRRLRDLLRRERLRWWMVPIGLAFLVPVAGVVEKIGSALSVVSPGSSLAEWGGDLGRFLPAWQFIDLNAGSGFWPVLLILIALALVAFRRIERQLAWGLGLVIAVGLLVAVYFRHRQYGWYFHYKVLAFVGPLLVVCAVAGATRLRRFGPVFLVLLLFTAWFGARDEIKTTGFQLPQATIDLAGWARALPAGTSVRLDMPAPMQLWAGYFLDSHPLCSQTPLYYSQYPRVVFSRKATYAVVFNGLPRPPDVVGAPLLANGGYRLYRLSPAIPGPDRCSLRRIQKINLQRIAA